MIDLDLLNELVTFKKYGTLSATAEHLMITQPSVTRGMKKLEQELGVELFERTANRISLNKTGELAAKKAKTLLNAEKSFKDAVINYANTNNTIKVSSVLPGPISLIENRRNKIIKSKIKTTSANDLVKATNVAINLQNYDNQLVFSIDEINNEEIESLFVGNEKLAVMIDNFNPLAAKKSVSFQDLADQSFLVVNDIGPWKKIIEDNIPDAKFLYQEDIDALAELSRYSNFSYFVSNLTLTGRNIAEDENRTLVPIEDDANKIEIYGSYLKNQKTRIKPLLKEIIKIWPN